jgi:tetratricopeptide (TPR) repeat protein
MSTCLMLSIITSGHCAIYAQQKQLQKCATDPTYKFFEEEQKKAYDANPVAKEIWQKTGAIRDAMQGIDKLILERPNSLNFDPWLDEKESQRIDQAVFNLKLPTCYENPLIYFMINHYVKEVERARRQLRLPLKTPPRYGSLPIPEINAYTYPALTDRDVINKRGSVIGFNTQLFMFAYQMTKVTLPTIDVRHDPSSQKVQIDYSSATALRAIESNPDLKINFAMALLEFLQLVTPSTEPLDRKFDADLMSFTTAMEVFAVAHEYGHLIKGHTLVGTRSLQLNPDQGTSVKPVNLVIGVRSWQQELEADKVGVQLLIQILRNRVTDSRGNLQRRAAELRQIYALYAALFFFKCSEIIDKARYINEHGTPRPAPTIGETHYVRALAEGRATAEQKAKYPNVSLVGHPPAWLRFEKARALIDQHLMRESFSNDAREYSQVASGLIKNIDILWDLSLPRLPTIIRTVREKDLPAEIGYVQSPAVWPNTFLYNPALNRAMVTFRERATSESDVIAQYREAVAVDWLLLSGLQVQWAETALKADNASKRGDALTLLALSGDRQSLALLSSIKDSEWSEQDRTLLKKVVLFLEHHGRDTSVATLARTAPTDLKLADLLSFPSQTEQNPALDKLIPTEVSREALEFLRRNRAVVEGRSLSSMALYMLIAKTDPSVFYSFWSDLLLRAGNADAALRYAREGPKTGPTAALENQIGNILSAQGDLRGAISHYEASLRLGRVDGWPEVNMAKNYADLGNLKEAENLFRQALLRRATARSELEYAGYLNEFAWFLATKFKGDTQRLKESLPLSLESNKIVGYSDPNYLDTLAECQAGNGDIKSAIKSAQMALDLVPPESPDRQRYAKRLEEFKSKQK